MSSCRAQWVGPFVRICMQNKDAVSKIVMADFIKEYDDEMFYQGGYILRKGDYVRRFVGSYGDSFVEVFSSAGVRDMLRDPKAFKVRRWDGVEEVVPDE